MPLPGPRKRSCGYAAAGNYSPARNAAYGIYRWDLRQYGMFLNGWRKGSTRPFALMLTLGLIGLYVAQMTLRVNDQPMWLSLMLVGISFIVGYAGNAKWGRIFRREMGAEN